MKEHFDKRLRKRRKEIKPGGYVLLRREKGGRPEGDRHKLAPRVDGPYRVKKRTDNTAVIERGKVNEEVKTSRLERVKKPKNGTQADQEPVQGERETT